MEDPRFATPMVSLPNGQHVFVHECVTFTHPKFGLTAGIVTKYYLKVTCTIHHMVHTGTRLITNYRNTLARYMQQSMYY